jgi:hypothetical protein
LERTATLVWETKPHMRFKKKFISSNSLSLYLL